MTVFISVEKNFNLFHLCYSLTTAITIMFKIDDEIFACVHKVVSYIVSLKFKPNVFLCFTV